MTEPERIVANIFYEAIPGARNGPLFWIVWSVPDSRASPASRPTLTTIVPPHRIFGLLATVRLLCSFARSPRTADLDPCVTPPDHCLADDDHCNLLARRATHLAQGLPDLPQDADV
jgi:hypothetical protein